MLRQSIKLAIAMLTTLTSTLLVLACSFDHKPSVLLITSYANAEKKDSQDKLVFNQLKSIYGAKSVATIYSDLDDNAYAYMLQKLIPQYKIQKVFVMDHAFTNYLPKDSKSHFQSSNFIRIMQDFSDTNFYFFNNQIANNIKSTANIYDFRLDSRNVESDSKLPVYGKQIAENFYKLLTGQINATKNELIPNSKIIEKYKFDIDNSSNFIIRIGIINNIGNSYQQKLINEFYNTLKNNPLILTPKNSKYVFSQINTKKSFNLYNNDNLQIVQNLADYLFVNNSVNFILNTNDWYNDAIAFAAGQADLNNSSNKTLGFIGANVNDIDHYAYQGKNYLALAFKENYSFLNSVKDKSLLLKYKIAETDPENQNTYGIDDQLTFFTQN